MISLYNSEIKYLNISVSKVIDLFEKGIILLLKNSAEVEILKLSISFYLMESNIKATLMGKMK